MMFKQACLSLELRSTPMQYGVRKIYITKNRKPQLYGYFSALCGKAKLLHNAALFRIRNHFTGRKKEHLTANEQEVEDEISLVLSTYAGLKGPGTVLSYKILDKIMRITHNPDYFSGLPMQSAELMLKQARCEFTGWLSALRKYKKEPSKFTGRPRMPRYTRGDMYMVKFTNQDCLLVPGEGGASLIKFPLTKQKLPCGKMPPGARLKEVQCRPEKRGFLVFAIYEADDACPDGNNPPMPYAAAIDLGVDNLAAIVNNAGVPCRIYKGGAAKAMNQWYNKETAGLRSAFMKGHNPEGLFCPVTKRMASLSKKRTFFLEDFFHKTAKDIVVWCMENQIGTLICGVNPLWKQGTGMGTANNQSFVQMPFYRLRQMLSYLCVRAGIRYMEQEESYTSKASAIDADPVPVYKKGGRGAYPFSGRRAKRGLYRSADGTCVNADLNGAANIGRKAFPHMFDGLDMKQVLGSVETVRFSGLYTVKVTG